MSRVRIKICGITRVTDADAAVEAGVDAIGFVLWKGSARSLSPVAAARIAADLPPHVVRVGVFADEPGEALAAALRTGRLDSSAAPG